MQVVASNFKAYDIRGIVGTTIDETFAEHLGRAFGTEALAAGERTAQVFGKGFVDRRADDAANVLGLEVGCDDLHEGSSQEFARL